MTKRKKGDEVFFFGEQMENHYGTHPNPDALAMGRALRNTFTALGMMDHLFRSKYDPVCLVGSA